MILEITFNDNDYTQIIENFLDVHRCDSSSCIKYLTYKYEDDIDKYRKITGELTRFIMDMYSSKYYIDDKMADKYIEYLKESMEYYIELLCLPKDTKRYLIEELSIRRRKNVSSKWENGETVYWFMMCNKYLTM